MRFLSILVLSLGIASAAVAAVAAESPATLTVSGEGEVAATPDMATLTLGVTQEAKTAQAAMDAASTAMADILSALQAAGIAARDIQTGDLSLNPVWSNRSYDSNGAPQITGFMARNILTVRVREMAALGGVMDQVLSVGANSFQGLGFGLQDPQPKADAARVAAVQDAMRKAALLAEAAGVKLGPVLSISDQGGNARPQPVMMEAMRSSAVPVAEGEVSLSARVTMVFALED